MKDKLPQSPLLETPPRIRKVNEESFCDYGDIFIDFGNKYVVEEGQELYDWQEDIIRTWVSVIPNEDKEEPDDPDWVYAHKSAGVDAPRQNGKSKGPVCTRGLGGAIFFGEKIRYSAHRVDTMLDIFNYCVDILGDPRKNPKDWRDSAFELREFCEPEFNFTNGHQQISFKGGGFIRFASRATGSGRGQTVDVNIYDEAQTLTDIQQAAMKPSQSSAPKKNPQTIYIGTPPDVERGETGETFAKIRQAAILGEPGYSWHEWSVEKLPEKKELADRSLWARVNPAYGKNLIPSWVETELNEMTPLRFAIERLCYWPPTANPKAIDPEIWNGTTAETQSRESYVKQALGVKFDPDGMTVCAVLAAMDHNGRTHCELVHDGTTLGGIQDLEDLIFNNREKFALVAIDGRSGSGEMFERLIKRKDSRGRTAIPKQQLHIMKTSEVPTAASMLINGLSEKTITHKQNQTLDASAKGAERRKVGNDGYGFGHDSCALEAMAAANWAVRTTTRSSEKRRWKK